MKQKKMNKKELEAYYNQQQKYAETGKKLIWIYTGIVFLIGFGLGALIF